MQRFQPGRDVFASLRSEPDRPRRDHTDSESAASLTVTGACEAQVTCARKDDCARIDLHLKNGGPTGWEFGFGGNVVITLMPDASTGS
jgi:hypothetical protein